MKTISLQDQALARIQNEIEKARVTFGVSENFLVVYESQKPLVAMFEVKLSNLFDGVRTDIVAIPEGKEGVAALMSVMDASVVWNHIR